MPYQPVSRREVTGGLDIPPTSLSLEFLIRTLPQEETMGGLMVTEAASPRSLQSAGSEPPGTAISFRREMCDQTVDPSPLKGREIQIYSLTFALTTQEGPVREDETLRQEHWNRSHDSSYAFWPEFLRSRRNLRRTPPRARRRPRPSARRTRVRGSGPPASCGSPPRTPPP